MRAGNIWTLCLLLGGVQLIAAQLLNICHHKRDGARVALPTHCSRYVVCREHEIAEIGKCPRGLHFNRELGECDFQWRAKCLGISAFAVGDADDCVCTCCAEECPNNAPADDTTTTCAPGSETTTPPVTVTQSPGDDSNITPSSTISPPGSSTNAPATTTTVASETPSAVPVDCVDKRDDCLTVPDGSLLAVAGQCNQFIQCSAGCAYVQTCPNNLSFDPVSQMCNHTYLVQCTSDNVGDGETVGPSGTTCSNRGVCADQRDGQMFADPDTTGYLVCQCECPIAMPCPPQTHFNKTGCVWTADADSDPSTNVFCPGDLVYNSDLDQCDWPEGYVPVIPCNSTSKVCDGQKDGSLFPMEGVCNKFYKCNFNCPTEQNCPNNLIFDTKSGRCGYPQDVQCEWDYVPPSGPNAGPSGIACESNNRCTGQKEGIYMNSETSCGNYVVCKCECEVEMSCSKGLYWNQAKLTCDYPRNVKCTL